MKTYELSLSPNYVSNWKEADAVRELLQNAIDQENMETSYLGNTLSITSRGVKLDVSTLILGNTTKANQSDKIGQYGEGYKLALLVLLRNGHDVTIYNGAEIWHPYFEVSETFNTPVLKIDVEDICDNISLDQLTFEITNISEFVYADLKKLFPCIENDFGSDIVDCENGQILLDKRFTGKIFVGGLYVQDDSNFKYGYNFKPEVVTLDRDRKAINYWSLRKLTAGSLITAENCHPKIFKAISDTFTDAKDILDVLEDASDSFLQEYRDMYYEDNHLSDNAIVVTKGVEKELSGTNNLFRDSFLNIEDCELHTGSEIEAFIISKANGTSDWFQRVFDSSEERTKSKDALYEFRNSEFRQMLVWHNGIKNNLSDQENQEFVYKFFNTSLFQSSYFSKIKKDVLEDYDNYLDDDFLDELMSDK